ncbi:MAG: hypothetical protein HY057_03520 [Rhodospirillales bacterium]|nr:hypothetical protein [Rhodospirillales bacterium]
MTFASIETGKFDYRWLLGTTLYAVVAAAAVIPAGAARAAESAVMIDVERSAPSRLLAATVQNAFPADWRITRETAVNDAEMLSQLVAGGSVGLVQRDVYAEFLRQNPTAANKLEFYGDLPACVLAVVRRGSPVRGYDDLAAARGDEPLSVDIGPADAGTAAMFTALQRIDPALAGLRIEHRGGSRALSRVVAGQTDVAVIVTDPATPDDLFAGTIAAGTVEVLPFTSAMLAKAFGERTAPYALKQVEIGAAGWFAAARKYDTACTTYGAAVNAKDDTRLSEAVARAVLGGSVAASRPPFWGIGEIIASMIGEVQRLVASIGEQGNSDIVLAAYSEAQKFVAVVNEPGKVEAIGGGFIDEMQRLLTSIGAYTKAWWYGRPLAPAGAADEKPNILPAGSRVDNVS